MVAPVPPFETYEEQRRRYKAVLLSQVLRAGGATAWGAERYSDETWGLAVARVNQIQPDDPIRFPSSKTKAMVVDMLRELERVKKERAAKVTKLPEPEWAAFEGLE